MQHRLDIRTHDAMGRLVAQHAASTVWVISGDDPLLTGEAADALRGFFKEQGVSERQLEFPDRSFDWKGWLAESATGSLFSERRLMDLRLPTGRPGTEGSKALQAWCEKPPDQVVLLVSLPRADRAMLGSAWMTALERAGQHVIVPELYRSDLPNWISQRLRAQGLSATPDALQWIADRCEGNLIAAHQEILRLALHGQLEGQTLSLENLQGQIAHAARFNPFQVGETILAGDARRALRVLRGLKEEGEPLPLILWAIAEDLRMVARTQQLTDQGRSADAALREARIPRHKERLVASACRRMPLAKTLRALRQAAEVDTIVKGLKADDPWITLERLALDYASIDRQTK
jgi:DNA polymerase-3 subunit delta